MERNATPEGRTVDDHQFVRPDENTRIPSQLTNNSPIVPASLAGNFRYIPEDSCDSILSFDDQDDDDDDDSLELSSKSLSSSSQAGRPYQGILSGEFCIVLSTTIDSYARGILFFKKRTRFLLGRKGFPRDFHERDPLNLVNYQLDLLLVS